MICGSRRTALKIARSRQNKWNDNREKMQTELETGSKDASEDNRSLLEEVQVETGRGTITAGSFKSLRF